MIIIVHMDVVDRGLVKEGVGDMVLFLHDNGTVVDPDLLLTMKCLNRTQLISAPTF